MKNCIVMPDQRRELINTTLKTMKEYVAFSMITDTDDVNSIDLHMEDVAYMAQAVREFAATGDLGEFEDAVMSQDTFVREYYIDTLRQIAEIFEELYDLETADEYY